MKKTISKFNQLLVITTLICSVFLISQTAWSFNQLNDTNNSTIDKTAIAHINDNNEVVPLFDTEKLTNVLVSQGFFAEIESIEITYTFSKEENKKIAYLIIIGKNKDSLLLEGFVAELHEKSKTLFLTNPIFDGDSFTNHSCETINCNNSTFKRDALKNIIGCSPCEKEDIVDNTKRAGNNHTITNGDTKFNVLLVKTIVRNLN